MLNLLMDPVVHFMSHFRILKRDDISNLAFTKPYCSDKQYNALYKGLTIPLTDDMSVSAC